MMIVALVTSCDNCGKAAVIDVALLGNLHLCAKCQHNLEDIHTAGFTHLNYSGTNTPTKPAKAA